MLIERCASYPSEEAASSTGHLLIAPLADQARLDGLARALDQAIATFEHGDEQQEEAMFNGFDPSQYEDEARERWGHTDAYKESATPGGELRRGAMARDQGAGAGD